MRQESSFLIFRWSHQVSLPKMIHAVDYKSGPPVIWLSPSHCNVRSPRRPGLSYKPAGGLWHQFHVCHWQPLLPIQRGELLLTREVHPAPNSLIFFFKPDFLLNWHKEILFILPINVISAPPFFPSSLKVIIECLGFVSCLGRLLEATTFRAAAGFGADSLTSSLSDLRRWGKGCMSPWESWVLVNTAVNYWESLSGLCHLMHQEWDNGLGSVTLDVHTPEAEARPDDLSRFLLVPVPYPWDHVPFPAY